MKSAVLALCLLGVVCANSYAQQTPTPPSKAYTPLPEGFSTVQGGIAPVFKSISDTVRPDRYLSSGDEVLVVGRYSPRWFVIRRGKADLIIAAKSLSADAGQPRKSLPIDQSTGLITFSEIVAADGTAKTELYARAKVWFADNFNSAKAVIQTDEKEAGVLIGRAWSDISVSTPFGGAANKLWYSVRISCKDGRYKYDISNFGEQGRITTTNLHPDIIPAEKSLQNLSKVKTDSWFGKILLSEQQQIEETATRLSSSLKAAMAKPAAGDW